MTERQSVRRPRNSRDYVHYNPVKHGLVEDVEDWPWSSYHRWARETPYPQPDWHTPQDGFKDLDVRK